MCDKIIKYNKTRKQKQFISATKYVLLEIRSATLILLCDKN